MTKAKWQMFWGAFIVFLVMTMFFLSEKGVFVEAGLGVMSIVGLLLCAVGAALYFYVKGYSDDPG